METQAAVSNLLSTLQICADRKEIAEEDAAEDAAMAIAKMGPQTTVILRQVVDDQNVYPVMRLMSKDAITATNAEVQSTLHAVV